jgi:mono/diheme cytochrome c family protein
MPGLAGSCARRAAVAAFAAAGLVATSPALSLTAAEQRGLTFAQANCSLCHAVLSIGASPLEIAPPLRSIASFRDLNELRQALQTGNVSEHPTMPHFVLPIDQVNDLIDYLRTFAGPAR